MRILDLYDSFSNNRKRRGVSLALISTLLLLMLSTLDFNEDISDFLPLGVSERENLSVYQNISGAERLFIIFSNRSGADSTIKTIDSYISAVREIDSKNWCKSLSGRVDMDNIARVTEFVYENIPYFLTPSDYARMDSLLAIPGYVENKLAEDKHMLLFPSSSFVSGIISHDPLGLFSPVMSRLQASSTPSGFEILDGYIFTADMSRAVVTFNSPFGNSETENNSKLLELLETASSRIRQTDSDIDIDIIGGPAIAVGNASRIKKDSFLAISLSFILITLLLVRSFKSARNILLIFISIGWGLVFALGGMALLSDRVSIIVVGISSVILGIAVNYPLHLIAHSAHQPDRRKALKEIVSPLMIGNITTVGAFLALVPLKSAALRDLGLFASLLLVGTILFVLIYLPHYMEVNRNSESEGKILKVMSGWAPETSRAVVIGTLMITAALTFYSNRTEFDSDISHINYITENQKVDMQYFEDLFTNDSSHTAQALYVFGKGKSYDEALEDASTYIPIIDSLEQCGKLSKQNSAATFIVSKKKQSERIEKWNNFIERNRVVLYTELDAAAPKNAFSTNAFSGFTSLLEKSISPKNIEDFSILIETVFSNNFTCLEDSGVKYVVYAVNVEPPNLEEVGRALEAHCFDIAGINRAMAGSLSDNFNYIGWACSLIVFFFLWFSFGRVELALISFLPMAVSWLWILGIMALIGIKFNIVNIILATFIFGQGDDYTIFMTEGCQYEYSRRKPILGSYKSSILQSAAIMFVGMGTLIVARHPAMRSLAEVTIVGMFSVVLMAYLIPPFLFKWATSTNGHSRKYPITLRSMLFGIPKKLPELVKGRFIYKGKEIEQCVRHNLKAQADRIMKKDLSSLPLYEYSDEGYGELAILLALSHPEVKVVADIPDDEHRQIARIAAEGIENIEFKSA